MEVQNQGVSMMGFWWRTPLDYALSVSLWIPPWWTELENSFIRALSPFIRAPPSGRQHLPKAPLTHTIALGIKLSHTAVNFEGTWSFRPVPECIRSACMHTHCLCAYADSLWPHGLQPASLLCPWSSPFRPEQHFMLRGWVTCCINYISAKNKPSEKQN